MWERLTTLFSEAKQMQAPPSDDLLRRTLAALLADPAAKITVDGPAPNAEVADDPGEPQRASGKNNDAQAPVKSTFAKLRALN